MPDPFEDIRKRLEEEARTTILPKAERGVFRGGERIPSKTGEGVFRGGEPYVPLAERQPTTRMTDEAFRQLESDIEAEVRLSVGRPEEYSTTEEYNRVVSQEAGRLVRDYPQYRQELAWRAREAEPPEPTRPEPEIIQEAYATPARRRYFMQTGRESTEALPPKEEHSLIEAPTAVVEEEAEIPSPLISEEDIAGFTPGLEALKTIGRTAKETRMPGVVAERGGTRWRKGRRTGPRLSNAQIKEAWNKVDKIIRGDRTAELTREELQGITPELEETERGRQILDAINRERIDFTRRLQAAAGGFRHPADALAFVQREASRFISEWARGNVVRLLPEDARKRIVAEDQVRAANKELWRKSGTEQSFEQWINDPYTERYMVVGGQIKQVSGRTEAEEKMMKKAEENNRRIKFYMRQADISELTPEQRESIGVSKAVNKYIDEESPDAKVIESHADAYGVEPGTTAAIRIGAEDQANLVSRVAQRYDRTDESLPDVIAAIIRDTIPTGLTKQAYIKVYGELHDAVTERLDQAASDEDANLGRSVARQIDEARQQIIQATNTFTQSMAGENKDAQIRSHAVRYGLEVDSPETAFHKAVVASMSEQLGGVIGSDVFGQYAAQGLYTLSQNVDDPTLPQEFQDMYTAHMDVLRRGVQSMRGMEQVRKEAAAEVERLREIKRGEYAEQQRTVQFKPGSDEPEVIVPDTPQGQALLAQYNATPVDQRERLKARLDQLNSERTSAEIEMKKDIGKIQHGLGMVELPVELTTKPELAGAPKVTEKWTRMQDEFDWERFVEIMTERHAGHEDYLGQVLQAIGEAKRRFYLGMARDIMGGVPVRPDPEFMNTLLHITGAEVLPGTRLSDMTELESSVALMSPERQELFEEMVKRAFPARPRTARKSGEYKQKTRRDEPQVREALLPGAPGKKQPEAGRTIVKVGDQFIVYDAGEGEDQ